MANIKEYLDNILSAIFGKDVRQSIHDSIEAINEEVAESITTSQNTKNRQDLLEQKYDEQIENIASSEPQNAEIVDARGGFSTLGSIIKQKVFHFENVEAMKDCLTLVSGDVVQTLGYYSKNDGGEGLYEILNDSSLEDDGGSIHELDNGLKAKLIIENDTVNVKQFGAKGDGITDDTEIIQYVINNYKNINMTKGTYLITSTISISNCVKLFGSSCETCKIEYIGTGFLFNCMTKWNERASIENIEILGTEDNNFLNLNYNNSWGVSFLLKNFRVNRFSIILKAYGLFNGIFENGCFSSNGIFEFEGSNNSVINNANVFKNVYFKTYSVSDDIYPNYRMYLKYVNNMLFLGCSFEQCNTFFNLENCSNIVLQNCGVEQMSNLYNGSGLIFDNTSYAYGLNKLKETDYCLIKPLNPIIPKFTKLKEQNDVYHLRKIIRQNANSFSNSSSYCEDVNGDSVPIYEISDWGWRLFMPFNIIQNNLTDVNENSINMYNVLHDQDNEATFITAYVYVAQSDASFKIYKHEYLFRNKTTIIDLGVTVLKSTIWSGSELENIEITDIMDKSKFEVSTNDIVSKLHIRLKYEKIGDSF